MNASTIRSTVEQALRNAGGASYIGYADGAIRSLERDSSNPRATIEGYLRERGYAAHIGTAHVEAVITALSLGENAPATTPAQSEGEVAHFDREHASTVIRDYAARVGADMSEVENVLIEAGLVDEPVEEPEAEVEDDDTPAWAKRLIEKVESLGAFAQRHGFRG